MNPVLFLSILGTVVFAFFLFLHFYGKSYKKKGGKMVVIKGHCD